ncbi:hypothetical protein [Streptomyces sp. NPDC054804]
MADEPPFIDEHTVFVKASSAVVWQALVTVYGGRGSAGPSGMEGYGHLVGAEPRRRSGEPLAEGSTLPGFEVAESAPGRLVRFTGRHRFSRYALVLALAERDGGTVLGARTYAEFPGPAGWVYRQLVISSGAHAALMTRQLHAVRRRAEASGPAR